MIKLTNNTLGTLFAIGAVLIWALSFVLARGLSAYVPPITLSFWRWTIAFLSIAPFALKNVMEDWIILKQNIAYLSIVGFVGVTIYTPIVYVSSKTTSSFNLSLIATCSPIFIVGYSVFYLKEYLKKSQVIGILTVIVGVMLLLTKGDYQVLTSLKFSTGDLWMLFASSLFAVYVLLVKRKPTNITAKTFLFMTFLIGDALLLPAYLWERNVQHAMPILNNKIIYGVLYLGILASLVAFYWWNEAIAKIGTSKTALIYYLIPVLSGILGYLYLGETITIGQIASMLLIIVGLLIYNRATPN